MDMLHELPLFANLPDHESAWIASQGVERVLETGEFYVHEGEPTDTFFIVLAGELQVTRTIDGKPTVVGTLPAGVFANELPLLNGTPAFSTIRAMMPTRLLVLGLGSFRGLFGMCPVFGGIVLRQASERTQWFAGLLKQQEKMAALGKLAAGLSHELNNPAAAARRAASTLREVLPALHDHTVALCELGLQTRQFEALVALQRVATVRPDGSLSPLELSDREDALTRWLEEVGVVEGWELATSFVAAGVSVDSLVALVSMLPEQGVATALRWLNAAVVTARLVDEIEQSSTRISDLVGAIKRYTYMDRALVQEVDIHQGLDTTLAVLRHKLDPVTVVRRYDSRVPRIHGNGSELNQVWTNLIDNAIAALDTGGTIQLTTRWENDHVMVEVADNGRGIPEEIQGRIFEPFFTTKGFGYGTGLGLDITYRIIEQHGGTIEVHSRPGHTRFIVRLPSGPSAG